MPKAALITLAAIFLLPGCAVQQPASSGASLPDGRDLSEHPLDVLEIPQP